MRLNAILFATVLATGVHPVSRGVRRFDGIEGAWRICVTRTGMAAQFCGNAEVTQISATSYGITHTIPLDSLYGWPRMKEARFGTITIASDTMLRIQIGTYAPGQQIFDGGLNAIIPWPRDKATGKRPTDSLAGFWGQGCRGGCETWHGAITFRRPIPGMGNPPPSRALDSSDIRFFLRAIAATPDSRVIRAAGDSTERIFRILFNGVVLDTAAWVAYRAELFKLLQARPLTDQDQHTREVIITGLEVAGDELIGRYSIGDQRRCPTEPWAGGGTGYQMVASRAGAGWGPPRYQTMGFGMMGIRITRGCR
jgi:hypothetical protein